MRERESRHWAVDLKIIGVLQRRAARTRRFWTSLKTSQDTNRTIYRGIRRVHVTYPACAEQATYADHHNRRHDEDATYAVIAPPAAGTPQPQGSRLQAQGWRQWRCPELAWSWITRNKDLCVVQWSMPITERSTMPLRDAKFVAIKARSHARLQPHIVRSRRQDWTSLPPQVCACCDFCG